MYTYNYHVSLTISVNKLYFIDKTSLFGFKMGLSFSKSTFNIYIGPVNPFALRTAKTLWSFGHSECNRINLAIRQLFHFKNNPKEFCTVLEGKNSIL